LIFNRILFSKNIFTLKIFAKINIFSNKTYFQWKIVCIFEVIYRFLTSLYFVFLAFATNSCIFASIHYKNTAF